MDLALDDVIKQQRKGRGGGGGAGGSGGRGAGRGGRGRGGFGGRRQRGGTMPGAFRTRPGSIPAGAWRQSGGGLSTAGRQSLGTSAKLLISNLDYGVSDRDIKELFSEFGSTRRAVIHYDQSGRSLGSAEVVFERRADAQRAIQEYNNVPLDGRPMKISMVGAGMAVVTGSEGGARVMPQQQAQRRQMNGTGRARGGGGRGGGRGRGAGGAAKPKKEPATTEDLDAQLDAYISKA